MIKYKSQYEAYYSQLRNKVGSLNIKDDSNNEFLYSQVSGNYRRKKSDKLSSRIINKIVVQTIISMILFLGVIATKYTDIPKISEIYKISKEIVSENYEYEEMIDDLNMIGSKVREVFNKGIE